MTTESVAPETLHVWAICLQAGEEARRRGDRRYGTDHILLALFEDPSIEAVLGVSLQEARQSLDSLDHEALGALGLGSGTDVPNCRCAPCRRSRGSETSCEKIAFASRPRQRKCLRKQSSPTAGRPRSRPSRAGPNPHSPTTDPAAVLRALSAWTRQRFGVDWIRSRPIAESPATFHVFERKVSGSDRVLRGPTFRPPVVQLPQPDPPFGRCRFRPSDRNVGPLRRAELRPWGSGARDRM